MKQLPFAPDAFMESLYETKVSPYADVKTADDCALVSAEIRKKVREILNEDGIPNKISELKTNVVCERVRKGYKIKRCSAEICEKWNMLFYIVEPEKPNGAGVIALCGHGYGARQIIRRSKRGNYRAVNFFDNYQKNFALALAEDGNTVIVPELIGFGEARLKKDSKKPFYLSSCATISYHALTYGLTTASLRVYQARRCADILESVCGVSEIGIAGISGGGLVALYTACADERIAKTAVCGYINTLKNSILSLWHCPDNYIPSMLKIGETYDIASAIAPRKLLSESGTVDKIFPLEGSEAAIERITEIYALSGAAKNYRSVVFSGKHEVSLKELSEFFKK